MNLYLHRFKQDASGTFGLMVLENKPLCVTCEDPWNNNAKNASCIPEGVYEVVERESEKYKKHWHVLNVPNRSLILIHNGNNIDHTEGCILVGEKLGFIVGKPSVVLSMPMMEKLRHILPQKFTLTITNLLKG